MRAGDDVLKKFFKLREDRRLKVGGKTLIMGILNVTPDSFSDGGKYFSVEAATAHAAQMIEYGADIIDIGAESTRPNAIPISAEEEFARLEKVVPAVKNLGVPISIDTYKPEVASRVLQMGADIINDVHGLEDVRMIDVAKKFN
ncbi:MAG: dihydropteroate synthase, partial [Selenomonadaceae bacterium]|nr:dihydropteroate synthase [Selenomonadaceae bacterium]